MLLVDRIDIHMGDLHIAAIRQAVVPSRELVDGQTTQWFLTFRGQEPWTICHLEFFFSSLFKEKIKFMPGPHRGLLLKNFFPNTLNLDFCLWCKWCNIFLPCQIKLFSCSDSRRSGLKLLFWFFFFIYQKSYSLWNSWQDTIPTTYTIPLAFRMKTITIQNIKYICPTVLVGYITTVCSCSWGNFSQMRELPFWQGKVPSFLFAFPSFLLSFCFQRNFHLVVQPEPGTMN